MVKDWTEIINEMRTVEAMDCKPNFSRLHNGFITDEDETVKWNREQVEKNHIAYDKEVVRLNTSKNKARDKVMQDVYRKIQQEIELVPDIKHAKAFYQVAQNIVYIKSGCKKKIPFENIIYQLKEECELFKQLECAFREMNEKSEELEKE